MWDLPGPGLKPVSPALASGFLTTAPQGSSNLSHIFTGVLFVLVALNSFIHLFTHSFIQQ